MGPVVCARKKKAWSPVWGYLLRTDFWQNLRTWQRRPIPFQFLTILAPWHLLLYPSFVSNVQFIKKKKLIVKMFIKGYWQWSFAVRIVADVAVGSVLKEMTSKNHIWFNQTTDSTCSKGRGGRQPHSVSKSGNRIFMPGQDERASADEDVCGASVRRRATYFHHLALAVL